MARLTVVEPSPFLLRGLGAWLRIVQSQVTFTVPLMGHMVRIGLWAFPFILFRAMLGGLSSKEVPEQFDALSHTRVQPGNQSHDLR